ncbi:MAG: signal peptidase II [Bryobacteraceae bacterium]|nr:signal peptidase II [Bryobacteraceae bacterium]
MSRGIPLLIATAVFALDRITKVWIESNVELYSSFQVIPGFFDIVHTKNPGAAFGMFADSNHPLRAVLLIGVSLAVLAFIAWALLRPGRAGFSASVPTIAGLSLVFGGALGNIYDRVLFGQVTDFLEFYRGDWRFAAFNVADSAISVGAALLILDMWLSRKQESNAAKTH